MVTEAATAAPLCKLDDAGNELPADAASWSQTLDRRTGLIWCADPLDEAEWKEAMANAGAHKLGGFVWRAATIREQLSIVDYERFNPTFDTAFFRGPTDWYWTSSPLASSPGFYAWLVAFYYGLADAFLHDLRAFVRPVRSASSPGQ